MHAKTLRLFQKMACAAMVFCAVSACGGKSASNTDEAGGPSPGVIEGGLSLGDNTKMLKASSVPTSVSLVSFDAQNRLRVRDDKGTSSLLTRDAAPVVEWFLTQEEKRELVSGAALYRAADDFVWRFEDKLVTTYTKTKAGWTAQGNVKLWPTEEKAWRPLAMEDRKLIVFAEGMVREVTWDPIKFASREFAWPKGVSEPRGAGFFSDNVIWVYGDAKLYLVNLNTGAWKIGVFNDVDAAWGDIRSLAYSLSAEAKSKYSLNIPRSFAVLGSKGLFALPFEDAFVK
jgi:hypothetical protein